MESSLEDLIGGVVWRELNGRVHWWSYLEELIGRVIRGS